jgi:CDP-diglyceride synthetase
MMPDTSPSWSDGQVAALALIASSLVGNVLPNPFASLVAGSPLLSSLALWMAFPLVVMIPILLAVGARAGWRTRSAFRGLTLGLAVSLLTTLVVLVAYVIGLALGQPQLLKIGLSWESLRDAAYVLATTTATGAALSSLGSVAGAIGRGFFQPRAADSL